MKYTTIIFFFITLINCSSQKDMGLDYCTMYKSDQSHLYSPTMTDAVNKQNLEKRKQVFIDNYITFKNYANANGFPLITDEMLETSDSCKYYFCMATLIHINQTQPKLFYSDDNIQFLHNAEKAKLLDNSLLYTAIKIGSHGKTCIAFREAIIRALALWELEASMIDLFEFKNC